MLDLSQPRRLSSLDVFFLLDSERNYGHVGALAILDPSTAPVPFSLASLRGLIRERLHLVPPFTQRIERVPLDLDWPYWVEDEDFDIDYHVRELALPSPGSFEQLVEQTARIYSRRLDVRRPLWELYLIHGLEGGRVAMVTKVHHAAVDGLSGGEILALLYDLSPEPRTVDAPPDGASSALVPSGRRMVAHTLARVPTAPARVAARVGRLLPHVDVIPSVLGLPGTTRVSGVLAGIRGKLGDESDTDAGVSRPRIRPPRGAYDDELSPHRVFGLGSISLTDVKTIKNAFGTTVNDVVVTLVAAGLREHMLAHGMLPDRPLVAMIPVSTRADDEFGTFGNEISVMFVEIPTHAPDPEERLRLAAAALRRAKERHNDLPAKALRDLTGFIPPVLQRGATRTLFGLLRVGIRPPYNVVISNVPGPRFDLYAAGARLEALYPLSILVDGAGLNVTVMSYRDSVDIGITADRNQTPDVQRIVDAMETATGELLELAGDA